MRLCNPVPAVVVKALVAGGLSRQAELVQLVLLVAGSPDAMRKSARNPSVPRATSGFHGDYGPSHETFTILVE